LLLPGVPLGNLNRGLFLLSTDQGKFNLQGQKSNIKRPNGTAPFR
jgi:hypothetical protein